MYGNSRDIVDDISRYKPRSSVHCFIFVIHVPDSYDRLSLIHFLVFIIPCTAQNKADTGDGMSNTHSSIIRHVTYADTRVNVYVGHSVGTNYTW